MVHHAARPPSGDTRTAQAFRGVVWSAVNTIIPTASGLLVFVVTSRLLTPVEFGIVALANALVSGAVALLPSGFGDALVQQTETRRTYLDSVFWLCLAAGLTILGALAALARPAAEAFGTPFLAVLLPVLGLRVLAEACGVVPTALVVQGMAFHLLAIRTLLATTAAALATIALVLAGLGIWALAASLLVNSLVSTIAMFSATRYRPGFAFSLAPLRALCRYGVYASGSRLINCIGMSLDQAMVGLVLGTQQLGLYNFARRVFALVNDVTSGALSAVAHPMFSGVRDDLPRVRRGFLTGTFLSSVLAFPLFLGLACVSDRAVPLLFGPHWTDAIWPIRILCGLGLVTCIGLLQGGLIASLGKAHWWFYYQLLSGLLNVPIILLAAPRGNSALLLAIVTKAYLCWPISIVMTLRLLGLRASDYLRQFAAPLSAAICMSICVLGARQITPDLPDIVALAGDVAVGVSTYGLILFLLAAERVRDLRGLVFGHLGKGRALAPKASEADMDPGKTERTVPRPC
jgi:O-antigen/teichoic acid export membrane protein